MKKVVRPFYIFLKRWRPSLLSCLFLMAGLLLTFRVTHVLNNVWNDKTNKSVTVEMGSEAIAKEESKKDAVTAPEKKEAPAAKIKEEKGSDKKSGKAKKKAKEIPFDPLNLTEGEVKLLFTLNQKKKVLIEKAEKLKEREKFVIVAEQRIDQKLDELKALKSAIEKIVDVEDKQVEQNTKDLVKIYESMKPKSAAKIFDKLPMSVLMKVVKKMSQKKVSPILAAMDVSKVKSLTSRLAQPSNLDLPSVVQAEHNPEEQSLNTEE